MNCLKVTDNDRRVRNWSPARVDSLGESSYSRQSTETQDTWRRIRLQQLLFKSVVQNDLNMIIRCLKHGADVGEEYTPYFQTVLHEAARRGFLRAAEILLRADANPNVVDEKSFLPLHYACQEGHVNTVKCLLLYGSMVTVENEYGDAPIHTAVRYGHYDLLPILLSVDIRRDFDRRKVPDRIQGQDHINLQNANGDTCLHIASALDRKLIVKRLLQWGADPTLVNNQDLAPMQVALEKENAAIIKLFRNPQTLVMMEKPPYSSPVATDPAPPRQPQQHPFKNFEGLQKYNDEITRHRMEHEGWSKPKMTSSPMTKAMSSDNVSHGNPSAFPHLKPLPRVAPASPSSDPPPSQLSVSSPRPKFNAAKIGHKVLPTKVVELEPQPNNSMPLTDGGIRGSRLQGMGQGQGPAYLWRAGRSATSLNLKQTTTTTSTTTTHSGILSSTKSVGDSINVVGQKDSSLEAKLDRRIEALSLEVDQKLQNLRTQYAELEKREEELRKSLKERDGKRKQSKSPSRRDRQEIRVTYENGGPIWVQRTMDSPSIKRKSPESGAGEPMKHVGNVKVEVKQKPNDANEDETVDGDEADRILKRYEEMVKSHEDLSTDKKIDQRPLHKPPKAPDPPRKAHLTTRIDLKSSDIDQSVSEETDRKVSHTYYIPPPPKAPEHHLPNVEKTAWIQNGKMVTLVNDVSRYPTPDEIKIDEPDYLTEDFSDTRVTYIKNGRRFIREAPKIRDMYSGRVGRVSPKIRDLQDQLRRSQYKQVHYELYDDY